MRQTERPRQAWPRWQTAATAAGIIFVGGAAAIAKWPHAWWWLVLITAAAATATPPALATAADRARRRQTTARITRTGLQQTTGASGAAPPFARHANLETRLHRSVLAIPYIHRDAEQVIISHLTARRPVLIVGTSMVGKTKMAAQVIKGNFGAWPVIIPDTKTALADLDDQDILIRNSVIWLDDLDRLIVPGGITAGSLLRLAAAGNVIIATIRDAEYDRFRPTDQFVPPEWDVMSLFERIIMTRDLTDNEQQRLNETVSNPEIRERIRQTGLGEYVGAAAQIREALQLGAAGTGGLGYPLIMAAADWRRCGISRPIPATFLLELATPHLDQRKRAQLSSPDALASGLAWASRDINPNVSLLQATESDSYEIYEFALDLITIQDAPIPDRTWTIVIEAAETNELPVIGYTAGFKHQHTEAASRAYHKAIASNDPEAAPIAALFLGLLLRGHHNDEAEALFLQAIDSGHHFAAPVAAGCLARLVVESHGDIEGARSLLQQAVDSAHPYAAPIAASDLGGLRLMLGDLEGAQAAYQIAMTAIDPDAATWAAIRLATMLYHQGKINEAKIAYERAVTSSDAETAAGTALGIAHLLVTHEQTRGEALAAYWLAIDSSDPQVAPRAVASIGWLLEWQGDAKRAQTAYRLAMNTGHAVVAPFAVARLERLLEGKRHIAGANGVPTRRRFWTKRPGRHRGEAS